jgi:hypothetical protein
MAERKFEAELAIVQFHRDRVHAELIQRYCDLASLETARVNAEIGAELDRLRVALDRLRVARRELELELVLV